MYKYAVYLAGAMHGRTVKEVLQERQTAVALCEMYGLSVYNPAGDEGLEDLTPNSKIDIKPNLTRMEWYVEKDDSHLDQCRTLLVLTGDISSSGTAWEMARMYYKHNRKIILVAPKMAKQKLVNFTTVKADFIRPTQEEAISLIAEILETERAPKI